MKQNIQLFVTAVLFIYISTIQSFAQVCPDGTATANLISNGAFTAGADGTFSSGFTYVAGATSPGTWGVSTNPQNKDSDFASLGDHTTGTGNMMVIDVDASVGKAAYQTTVNGIVPNTTYFFSAWFVNINKNYTNSPQLRFSINGTQVGATVTVGSTNRNWQQFFVSWNSGSFSGNGLVLRIDNMRNTATGNDLAIDDIVFTSSCNLISNRTAYGPVSNLPDTLFICDMVLPVTLNPQLNSSKHTYNWKLNSATSLATTSTYSLSTIPSYSKLYLCYDSIPDNITCPKLDSVIIIKKINADLGADQKLCEPFSVTLNSNNSTPTATYTWKKDGSTTTGSASSLAVSAVGTYEVQVARAGCPTATSQVTISTYTNALNGSGFYCVAGNEAYFTVNNASRINNTLNLKWYNSATGGLALTGTSINDSTIKVSLAQVGSQGSCTRALWIEDQNAFQTTLTQPTTTASTTTSTDARTRITVKSSTLTIDSLSFYADNNTSAAGTKPYQIFIYKSTDLTNPIYTSPIFYFPNVTNPTLRTIPIGYELAGNNTGLQYWIMITGQIAYYTNDPVYPYVNTGAYQVLTTNEFYRSGSSRPSEVGFLANIQATVGKLNPCTRSLICANVQNCTLPIEIYNFSIIQQSADYLEFNAIVSNDLTSNAEFYIEYSDDAENFFTEPVTLQGTSFISYKQSVLSAKYVRLKVVNGTETTFSNLIEIEHNSTEEIEIYPNPSSNVFNIKADDEYAYEITNSDGRLLESGTINQEKSPVGQTIFKSGIYILKLQNEEKIQQFKIEKR